MLGSIVTGVKRPNKNYIFSDVFTTEKEMLECLLSCGEYLNSLYDVKFTFGICRGDSDNWDDYTIIKNHEKFIVPERKLERTTSLDNLTFVSENGRWSSGAVVKVYEMINGVATLVTPDRYNRLAGSITFSGVKTNEILISLSFPSIYRIGIKIATFSNSIFPMYEFGLNFTTKRF